MPIHLLLPLVSAIVFVAAALLLKRASDLGADVWRTTRIINYTTGLVAAPLWLLGGTIPSSALWWQPPVAGVLFFGGQIFSLLALSTGDVSVATPVLGVKILLVALLTAVLIGDPVGARLWTAAALSTAAIALLNFNPGHSHRRVGTTILLSALGAASYACFDVLVQKWSPAWGTGRFLPIAMASAVVYSLPLRRFEGPRRQDRSGPEPIPAVRRPGPSVRRPGPSVRRPGPSVRRPGPLDPAFPFVAAGAVLLAVQGVMFITSISLYRQATSANVLYSSRGLWSVVAVWGIGHWFANREQHLGARVLGWRLVGATLLMAAIVMVLLDYGT
ncbi:MAG: EamA/RhaT family transporter [Acidobacteria bacterium]|nr:MAG: EamA/RhaT family transporter [Acidobacteriota bacterium]